MIKGVEVMVIFVTLLKYHRIDLILMFENTCTKFAVAPKPYVPGTKFDIFWNQDTQYYIFLKDCNIQLLVI